MSNKYKLLWLSFLISNCGDWLRKLALPFIIYEKTGSAFHMASLYGISFIPWIVFSLFGGVLADKFKKNKVIAFGHFMSLIFLGMLIIQFETVEFHMVIIYILTFLLSSVEPLVHPSFHSLLPQLVDKKDISKANAGLQLIDNTLNLMGPMVSGGLLIVITSYQALWINVVCFLIAGVLILFVHYESQVTKINHNVSKIIFNGLKYVKTNKVILSGSLLFFGTNLGIHILQANLVYYITNNLNYTSFYYGIILSISGIGAIIGSFIAPKLNHKYTSGVIISISTVIAGMSIILLALNTNYVYIGLMLAVSNMCGNINVITYFTLRQSVVPKEILGSVISVTRMISYMSIPLGAYIGGYLISNNISMFWIIILAGTIRLLAGILGYFSPLKN